MANVATFSANTDAHSLGIQYNKKHTALGWRRLGDNFFPRMLIYPNTIIQRQYAYISIC